MDQLRRYGDSHAARNFFGYVRDSDKESTTEGPDSWKIEHFTRNGIVGIKLYQDTMWRRYLMVGLSKKGTLVEELNLFIDKLNYKRVITANGFVRINV